MKIIKRFVLLFLILIILAFAGFVAWAETPLGAMPEALEALRDTQKVQVETSSWLTFRPADSEPCLGVILYPGGRVDARAYAPLAHAIAAEGYLTVIPPMPLNLAVLASGRAAEVIAAHPEIDTWVVGGHSLGGAMAASFVYANPNAAQGLLLWASYPAENNPLNDRDLRVLSIYGSLDNGVEKIVAAADRLPASTEWRRIEGGNHAQFGWYGSQPGDAEALISRQAQQEQILQTNLDFLAGFSPVCTRSH